MQSPTLWETEAHLYELFGDRVEWTAVTKREFVFRYHSLEHFAEWFMDFYGPITKLAGTLDGEDHKQFAAELADVPRAFDYADDGTVAARAEYLEAVGVRR